MSTEAICYRDAYAQSVDGARDAFRADSDEGYGLVVLDRTVFYPGGGGQPPDQRLPDRAATATSWDVRAARRDGADIVHEVVLEPGAALPAVGSDRHRNSRLDPAASAHAHPHGAARPVRRRMA